MVINPLLIFIFPFPSKRIRNDMILPIKPFIVVQVPWQFMDSDIGYGCRHRLWEQNNMFV
jgi:hypothetical protein